VCGTDTKGFQLDDVSLDAFAVVPVPLLSTAEVHEFWARLLPVRARRLCPKLAADIVNVGGHGRSMESYLSYLLRSLGIPSNLDSPAAVAAALEAVNWSTASSRIGDAYTRYLGDSLKIVELQTLPPPAGLLAFILTGASWAFDDVVPGSSLTISDCIRQGWVMLEDGRVKAPLSILNILAQRSTVSKRGALADKLSTFLVEAETLTAPTSNRPFELFVAKVLALKAVAWNAVSSTCPTPSIAQVYPGAIVSADLTGLTYTFGQQAVRVVTSSKQFPSSDPVDASTGKPVVGLTDGSTVVINSAGAPAQDIVRIAPGVRESFSCKGYHRTTVSSSVVLQDLEKSATSVKSFNQRYQAGSDTPRDVHVFVTQNGPPKGCNLDVFRTELRASSSLVYVGRGFGFEEFLGPFSELPGLVCEGARPVPINRRCFEPTYLRKAIPSWGEETAQKVSDWLQAFPDAPVTSATHLKLIVAEGTSAPLMCVADPSDDAAFDGLVDFTL